MHVAWKVRTALAVLALAWAAAPRVAFAQEGGYGYDGKAPVVTPMAGESPRAHHERGRRRVHDDEVERTPSVIAPDGFPLAGYHAGKLYLRDDTDTVRLYPGLLLQVDGRMSFGRGIDPLGSSSDEIVGPEGDSLRSRIFANKARLELGGEVLRHWGFYVTGDFAGTPKLEHAIVDVEAFPLLHVSVGQQQVPFTMENRSNDAYRAWMDRPLTVRFAQPSEYDAGILLWGETVRRTFRYEAGVFGGDGQNRGNVDGRFDGVARLVFRPLARTGSIAEGIHIGVSGFYGSRRTTDVFYDAAPLTTEGGFAFWRPAYFDPSGHLVRVFPSGDQRGIAGEVRVPVSQLDFRFEVVSVHRGMRESLDGFERTNVERYGDLHGSSFYVHLGVWVLGNPRMRPEPGNFRPPHVDFPRGAPPRPQRGLELAAHVESLSATYSATSRAAVPGDATPDRKISTDVVGGAINYYATRHVLFAVNYAYYIFPSSGPDGDNDALAPGNLYCSAKTSVAPAPTLATGTPPACHSGAHSLHELGARLQVFF